VGARLATSTQVKRACETQTILTTTDNCLLIMVPPANGGVETEQSGEKGLQNLTKIRKEVKHIPCIDVRLQRRMLHFAAVTNPNGNHEWQDGN